MYRRYLGGYGLGARLLFDRIPQGADPLGPDNILGLMPGLLTGTPLFGIRYQAVAKSPKTGGWGDANCGGDFGPFLKHAGWDGAPVQRHRRTSPSTCSSRTTRPSCRDASDLWGMDAIAVEEKLKERHGKKASVACIGPAGEMLSYMAGICNEHGRLAGRSGLGAVMGSKKLKAVVVLASRKILAGEDKDVLALVRDLDRRIRAPGHVLPQLRHHRHHLRLGHVRRLAGEELGRRRRGRLPAGPDLQRRQASTPRWKGDYACWHCPIACGAESEESDNPQYPYPEAHPSGGVRDGLRLRHA